MGTLPGFWEWALHWKKKRAPLPFFPGLKVNTRFSRSLLSQLYKPIRNETGWQACLRLSFKLTQLVEPLTRTLNYALVKTQGRHDRRAGSCRDDWSSAQAPRFSFSSMSPLKSCLLIESPQMAKNHLCLSLGSLYPENKTQWNISFAASLI